MEKNNSKEENSCPYPYPKKAVRQKTAEKKPVGTFYHPTEKTYRDGKCACGYVTKKGYKRHAYDKKDGTHVKHKYVRSTCVPNKGSPGKVLDRFKPIHLKEKNSLKPYNYKTSNNANTRFNKLLEAAKELSYRTVVLRLSQLRTLTKSSDPDHSVIYDEDMKRLKEWRIENPDLYKPVNKVEKVGGGHMCDEWEKMGYGSRGECVSNQRGGAQKVVKTKIAKKVIKPSVAKKVVKPSVEKKIVKTKIVKKVVKPSVEKKVVKTKIVKK